jgi:haloalkane dehalogenase
MKTGRIARVSAPKGHEETWRDSTVLVSADDNHPRRRVSVLDSEISFVDVGEGLPIVFLHGNPTSSYLWRNILPHTLTLGRCLAPDLVGMGRSAKSPANRYRFADHAKYLDEWFEKLSLNRGVTLVLHDWGSALGFHWGHRHPNAVRAIVYMESIVLPRRWEDFPAGRDVLFRAFRSALGDHLILDKNAFIEVVLPKSILRSMSEKELDAYREPFRDRDARLPMLAWPRELPIDGEPADVVAIVNAYGAWLASSPIPKLFIAGDPGAMLIGRARDFCETWPRQQMVTVPGIHYLQEDSPGEIGSAIVRFMKDLPD